MAIGQAVCVDLVAEVLRKELPHHPETVAEAAHIKDRTREIMSAKRNQ